MYIKFPFNLMKSHYLILHSIPCVLLGYSLANNEWWLTAFVACTAGIMSCFSFVIALIFVVNLGGRNG